MSKGARPAELKAQAAQKIGRRAFIKSTASGAAIGLMGTTDQLWADSSPWQPDKTLQRIAFGSCHRRTFARESHWQHVLDTEPDLWLWLGDAVYADNESPEERLATLRSVFEINAYAQLAKTVPIIGTWDDHDYAYNNADGSYELKDASQQVFMNFLQLPKDHPLHDQQGLYYAYEFGLAPQKVKVIVTDTRYFKRPPSDDSLNNLLGELQWQWLEQQLTEPDADLVIFASSVSLLSDITLAIENEGWAQFPKERDRLIELLNGMSTPLFAVSGDRHTADVARRQLPSGKWLYEFMSSGMTHTLGFPLPNPHRISPIVYNRNFGLITIDWSEPTPKVVLEIKSTRRKMQIWEPHTLDLSGWSSSS